MGRVKVIEGDSAILELRLGGTLAKVSLPRVRVPSRGMLVGGGKRGLVTGMSTASRRRMMRLIASVERGVQPIFVTLTLPGKASSDHSEWKGYLDKFRKRLVRAHPGAAAIWRIEFQTRKTGPSLGEVVPHYHLLVYGVSYFDLRQFVPGSWAEACGGGDEDHLRAGTRVERVKSFRGIMRYAAKYLTKDCVLPDGWQGRSWGVISKKMLPLAPLVTIEVPATVGVKIVRLARKMMKLKGKVLRYGVTWIIRAERVLDYIEFLAGVRGDAHRETEPGIGLSYAV